jgi:small subunit ribosomal protein S8
MTMIGDPIADMLARIRNAVQREREEVSIPTSRKLESIAGILQKEGFINKFEVKKDKGQPQGELVLNLRYVNGFSAITDLKRVSKPGLRKYVTYKNIPNVRKGLGISIMTTSTGIMTGKEAQDKKVGGELLAIIW